MNQSRQLVGVWVAYATALWAAVFAVFHIIWAAGSYPLLDAEAARVGFANPSKSTFDVVVAAMCVVAVAVGRFRFAVIGLWDWWFVLGAILFDVSTWRSRPYGTSAE